MGFWATEATPFVLKNAEQFRPVPPPDLKSDVWARDYNEIKEIGEKFSTKRTPEQTETARLWLAAGPIAYHPWVRQIAIAGTAAVLSGVIWHPVCSAPWHASFALATYKISSRIGCQHSMA